MIIRHMITVEPNHLVSSIFKLTQHKAANTT